jgi:hypothetical protein
MMEQEIMCIVGENQQSTTAPATDTDKIEEANCTYCNKNPCLWGANKEAMLQFDRSKHGLMAGNHVPPANLRRKLINVSSARIDHRRRPNRKGSLNQHATYNLRPRRSPRDVSRRQQKICGPHGQLSGGKLIHIEISTITFVLPCIQGGVLYAIPNPSKTLRALFQRESCPFRQI